MNLREADVARVPKHNKVDPNSAMQRRERPAI